MDAQQAQEGAVEKPLHVFVIGPDTFVAHDAEDAWTLLKEHTGLERGDDDVGDDEPIQVPDDKPLKIQLDECSPDLPEHSHTSASERQWFFAYTVKISNEGLDTVQLVSRQVLTLTAAEWCAREGRGFLCSTEY